MRGRKGRLSFLRTEETKRVLEKGSCTLSRIGHVYNLDKYSTKCRGILYFTGMVKGPSLALDIFSGEDDIDSLSECGFFYGSICQEMSPSTIQWRRFFYMSISTPDQGGILSIPNIGTQMQ